MRTARSRLGGAVAVTLALALSMTTAAPAAAAPDPLSGYDVSWPQCSSAQGGYGLPMPPVDADFMIVGLTAGLAFTENPCLADQAAFARTHAIPAHAYAMATFPTPGQLAQHGRSGPFDTTTRAGQLRNAGFAEGSFALASLTRIGWSPSTIWIDVEPRPRQPWPGGSATAHSENRLVIEGLLRAVHDAGHASGLYSYSSGWQEITGGWSLPGIPVWATAGTLDYPTEARDRCIQASFSGGEVQLSQWTDRVRDFNITCGGYRFSAPPLRVFGADRYATSVAASRQAFPGGADAAVVVTGADFADAVSGGPAAARSRGPVLLVGKDAVPPIVMEELHRLTPQVVYILGGTAAVSSAVQATLGAQWRVERVAGVDRYGTAAATADLFWDRSPAVFLAVGSQFADALSGGPAAAAQGAPVLLTRPDRLPPAAATQLRTLAPSRVTVLGGAGAVSDSVLAQVRATVPGASVDRVAGPDRYATSQEVVRRFWPTGSTQVYVATGAAFPDALSAVPLAAENDAPLVLTRPTCTPATTAAALQSTGADLRLLLGGQAALAPFVLDTMCPG